MVDNIDVDPGTTASKVPVATDEVATRHYQIIKVAFGADGVATWVTSSDPFPVAVISGAVAVTGSVTASGTVAATQSGTWNIATITTLPALAAGTNHIGQIETPMQYIDVTLSLHTTAGVADDLLADAQIVAACTRANDIESLLQSIVVVDEDANSAAIQLIFLDASTSLGTEGSAMAMTDAMCRAVLGVVEFETTDYIDLGGANVATRQNVGIVCKPATGTDDIYVAARLVTGTPTFTASGIRLRLGFI